MKILKASLLNITGRIISIASTFFSIFLLGRLFSVDDFGQWMWLFSIFSLITAQDFGFISAMRVRVGRLLISSHVFEQKLCFGVALYMILFLNLLILICLIGFLPFVESGGNKNLSLQFGLVVTCSLFTVAGYPAAQASMAYLESGWVGIAESFRGALQILAILIAYITKLSFMPTLVIFYLFTMMYTPLILKAFFSSRNWSIKEILILPLNHSVKSFSYAKSLLGEGVVVWVMQVGLAFLSLSDVFLAGLFMPSKEVAQVNVIARLVLLGVGFVLAASSPLAGHFVVKLHKLNREILRQYLDRLILALLVGSVLYGSFLYFLGPAFIYYWSTIYIERSDIFFIAGGVFGAMSGVVLMQIFLQIPMFTRAIIPGLVVCAILKIGLSLMFVKMQGYGGIFTASLIANFTFLFGCILLLFKCDYLEKIISDPSLS